VTQALNAVSKENSILDCPKAQSSACLEQIDYIHSIGFQNELEVGNEGHWVKILIRIRSPNLSVLIPFPVIANQKGAKDADFYVLALY
jgi:hypothetical protein